MSFNMHSVNDLVGSLLFEQLQEFSSAKKTCVMHIVNGTLQGYLTLKFGKPYKFYFKNEDISQFVLIQFLQENIISLEVYEELRKNNLSYDHIIEVLSEIVKGEVLQKFNQSFYVELVHFVLLDKKSTFFHISQKELSSILEEESYTCILEKSNMSMTSFGQSILDMYAKMKDQDFLFQAGNAVMTSSGKAFESEISKYDSACVPLDLVINIIPGMHLSSLNFIHQGVKCGDLQIVYATFEDGIGDTILEPKNQEKEVSQVEQQAKLQRRFNFTGIKIVSSNVTLFGIFSLSVIMIKLYLILHEIVQY